MLDAGEDNGSNAPPHALDAMTAAPDHHVVLLENDRVRILDTRLGPAA